MPKYPTDKRRYYDERDRDRDRDSDMSDPGRALSRGYSRGRPQDRDRQSRDDRSSSGHRGGDAGSAPRRPGTTSAPYPSRPSTSEGPGGAFPPSARGDHRVGEVQHSVPGTARGDHMSDTASVAGSNVGDGGQAQVGRGAMRGRRVLPVDIITRPRELVTKQGVFGDPVQLQANYFKLLNTPDWSLYKYCVSFEPEEDRNVIRKALLRPHRATLGAYIFDGSTLFTTNNLPEPLQLTATREADNTTMLINIKATGDMTRGDYQYIQFFNIIMRKCLDYLKLQLVGRNYFDARNKAEVREFRLELWPGYITSIRQHERDILMCAEITHKVMRNETLRDVLGECYHQNPHDYQKSFMNQVIGVVVLTDYNNNTYRIDDVDFDVTPTSTFKLKDGTEISYLDYYSNKYQIRISDMQQPLLVSKSKPKDRRAGKSELVYLIPELCRSTGLTDSMRNNNNLMRALAKYTRVSPGDRIKKLMNFNQRLQSERSVVEEFNSWNLKLDRQLVNVNGRCLTGDKIIHGHNMSSQISHQANWTRDITNKQFVKVGRLDDWVLVVPARCRNDCQSFVRCLRQVAGNMGFQIEEPYVYDIRDDNPATYAETLEQIKSQINPMLIFCVATSNRIDRYSAIKKKCCIDRPVPTQVVLAKSLRPEKSQMSIATKVAIQMNCKIGGIPWSISIPLQGLMVVGFDVCHDTNSKEKDIGAMVASLDLNFGRYFSAVSCHTTGEELSNDLSVNMCKAINEFKRHNKALPKRIVVYRDGVGEGQIHYVVSHEVKQIISKLEEVYDNPEDIKLAYVVVTKKINTRFFHKGQNPPPGTVVDDIVTDPSKYDFFIVSQHVGQGTVTPTAYNVIYDSSGLDVDKMQRLTYKLCHMYFNWSGTVRVPAPCQYAHKLAYLVAQAIHQPPASLLETLLYFL